MPFVEARTLDVSA